MEVDKPAVDKPRDGSAVAQLFPASMPEHRQNILEPGGTEVATAAGGARRYRKPLKSFRWRDIRSILGDSLAEWSKHNAPRLGAALSFYTLLSLAPLLLVLVSVAGLVFGQQAAETGIIRQFESLVGAQGARAAQLLIEGSRNTAHGIIATAFGLLTLLFGASGVLIELRDALNTIWDVPTPELSGLKKIASFVKERLFSFALVLAIGFLLVVSLAISALISALGAYSASILPAHEAALHILNSVISFSVTAGLFSAIYKFLPDVRIEWQDVICGAAFTSLLFTIGKLALGIYLGKATFASTYGAAASIVVLIVWVYYSAQIFFLGAEFTKIFANCYRSQPSRYPEGMVIASDQTKAPVPAPSILTPADAARQCPEPDFRDDGPLIKS
jgi:membrane protein